MKVLLRRNIMNLGKIGEVVTVKDGYARNYLLPQGLAVNPTKANVAAVEAEKAKYLEELAKQQKELRARADALQGKEITIAARANTEGALYGSVGPAQIVAALAEEGIFIEPSTVILDTAIRKLDKHEVQLVFGEDIKATIHVWIVPIHDESAEGENAEADKAPAEPPAAE